MAAYECRICAYLGADPRFCPQCLAETMRATDRPLPPPEPGAVEPPPTTIPIDGVLDLHTVRPAEVKDLVAAYLEECARLGVREVRIIHGKGKGALRRTVHSFLASSPLVKSFATADALAGGWGATIVTLH
ncbi:MAG TPA: Smr/MutS family protein [Polyangia bacterium]